MKTVRSGEIKSQYVRRLSYTMTGPAVYFVLIQPLPRDGGGFDKCHPGATEVTFV